MDKKWLKMDARVVANPPFSLVSLGVCPLFPLLGFQAWYGCGHHTMMAAGLNLGSPQRTLQHLLLQDTHRLFPPGKLEIYSKTREHSDVEKTAHVEDAFAWDGGSSTANLILLPG